MSRPNRIAPSLLAIVASLALVAGRARADGFTVDDAVALALANQPSLATARAQIDAATVEVDAVDVTARPTVTASAGYSIGARAGVALTDPVQGASAALTATWTVWDFGQRAARRRAAVATVVAQQRGLDQVGRAIVAQVERAYLDVVGARARAEIQVAALAAEVRHLDDAQRLEVAGVRTAIDVAAARARVATARVVQIRADGEVERALGLLEQAIGAPLPEDAAIVAGWPGPVADEAATTEALLAVAVRGDPTLSTLTAQLEAQAASRAATQASGRPTLAATASLGGDALGTYGTSGDPAAASWSAGVTLGWTLYDGGARSNRVRAADVARRTLEAERAARLVTLRQAIRAARTAVATAKAQQVAAGDSIDAAQAQVRLAEGQFAAGLATSTELADAVDGLTAARGDATDADYQLALARATLRDLLGSHETIPPRRESNR